MQSQSKIRYKHFMFQAWKWPSLLQYFNLWPFGNVSHSVPQRSLGLEAPVCTEGKQWLGEPKDICVVWREGFSYVVMRPSQNRTPVPSPLSWSSPRSAPQPLGSSLVLSLVGSFPQSSLTPQPLYPSAWIPTEFSGSLSLEHRSKLQEESVPFLQGHTGLSLKTPRE